MSDRRAVEVWASWLGMGPARRVGRLAAGTARGRTVFDFRYDDAWLADPRALPLDPRLQLFGGAQYPSAGRETFGVFLDSSPDRWGRTLLDRREAARARAEGRRPRALREMDYLLGVFDPHRVGGLRFRLGPEAPFLDDDQELASPPWTSLRELEGISRRLEEQGIEEHPSYARWLAMLVAPGRSLGGARPKASVVDPTGALWIAKFPSASDTEDVGGWEGVAHRLAEAAGITVPRARVERFASPFHTFLSQRFDRTADGERVHFASAMTFVDRADGEVAGSYLELAEVLIQRGAQPAQDLEELWRRVAFNVCISNVDDHLRNHGFLLHDGGWRLAPAYDMNPVPWGDGLTLNVSDTDNAQDLGLVLEVAELFRVKKRRAGVILDEVRNAVRGWPAAAEALGIPREARERMAPAFRCADTS